MTLGDEKDFPKCMYYMILRLNDSKSCLNLCRNAFMVADMFECISEHVSQARDLKLPRSRTFRLRCFFIGHQSRFEISLVNENRNRNVRLRGGQNDWLRIFK